MRGGGLEPERLCEKAEKIRGVAGKERQLWARIAPLRGNSRRRCGDDRCGGYYTHLPDATPKRAPSTAQGQATSGIGQVAGASDAPPRKSVLLSLTTFSPKRAQ